jgi:O-antigen/teichoic acid export membrane protein
MWAQSALMLFVIFLFVTGGPMLVWYRFATRQVTNTAVDPALIPHGTHQSWIDILGVVSSRIDSILVFHYLGAFEVATYAFAVLTAEQLKSFTASTFTIAGPKFAKNDLAHTLKSFGRKMLLMSLIGLMMSMAYYMVAPWMYRWFFPNYIGALSYSRVYAFSLIGMLPALLGNYLFNIKGLRRETTVVSLVNNAVLIGSVCIGGYMYGMWGIIYSRLFSSVFQCATIIWFVRSLRAREHVSHV